MNQTRSVRRYARAHLAIAAGLLACAPLPAVAQAGIFEALAGTFSDVSFYANTGRLTSTSGGVSSDRLTSYGIEVLLEIGSVRRQVGPAPASIDSVEFRWTGMQVTTSGGAADTVFTYDVAAVTPQPETVPIWTFEVGVGYGQTTGYRASTDGIDLRGSVRDLPAVSLYASYEPTGTYVGIRSGYMRFHALQVIDRAGNVFTGDAESFRAGAAIGQVVRLLNLNFFAEAAWSHRNFPSVRWDESPLPAELPRDINVSDWSLGAGVQFAIGRN